MSEATPYKNKLEILSDLWMNYRYDVDFQDFIEYNDIGLPLAYAIANNIVDSKEVAQAFVEETFSLLLAGLDVEDDDYENLDDLLSAIPPDEPPA